MSRIKLLHMVEDLCMGGLEKVVYNLCLHMDATRFDTRVWCLTKGGVMAERLAGRGLRPEVLGMGPKPTLRFVWDLAAKLRGEGIQILHTHGYTAGAVARAAGVLAWTPRIIAHVHTTCEILEPKQLWTDRFLSLFTNRILCCSQAVADSVAERERIPRQKLRVVYDGTPRMALPETAGLRQRLGIPERDAVLLCAASLTSHKGHRYLLDALPLVLERFPNTSLILAGDGPLRTQLQEQSSRLEIGPKVIFAGICPEIGELLGITDIAVLASSEREGLSLWLAEAMSAGKPLVAPSLGGTPEILMDKANGLLVPPRDSSALARAIIDILSSPALAQSLRAGSERIYMERFTMEEMSAAVASVYEEDHA